ncbi:MAG: acyl-CoA/acyl-ACP dehydrogenase [Actinobacteria bacterium]|nr:acyl-CoA/acyl-ACP dehydrogenase [Actinomycetota bacterium]MCA1720931.1 acyl-CoA/acyl-ACP dehydrogenase [Actinomycetota bacterium]
MDFSMTDEQRALQDAVRSYLRDRFGPQQVRAVYEDTDGNGIPDGLWKSIGEQGWLAVLVPEEHDGIGLGLLDASVIAREFGAMTTPGPWLSTILAGEAIRLAGSAEQQKSWLPRLAAGEVKAAVALHRPGSSPLPANAPATSEGGRVFGQLKLVEYAQVADLLVIAAPDGLYLVDPEADGITVTPCEALDRTTRVATLDLNGVEGERLENSSPEVVQDVLDRGAVLVANDLVGIARKALTETVEYDKTRVQFGKPVGSFQAIKHDLADLHVAVTMAEHAATYAAYAVDTDRDDKALAVSIAKSKAADTARKATSDMIQYHGGIGYTWEHDAHFYFKRAKRLEYAYGDAAQHRERIAKLLLDKASGAVSGATPGGTQSVQGTGVAAGAA